MTWQPAPILFPDAELTLTTALRTAISSRGESGVFVGNRIPATRRDRMVIVIRDGGTASNLRDRARMRVLVWDTTDQKATNLARLVVALAPTLIGSGGILRSDHLSGPYEVPDESKQPCRYLLFEFHLRGEQLTASP